MGKLIGDADQISGYGFSSTYLGNKASKNCKRGKFKYSVLSLRVAIW